ncbi:MAG: hypothetical protein JSV49_09165 [Thermoplasmata archaeon]|nr:MAG: hypothetical protein JSV49_09165 [Thermoplasmata archaeon]
MHRVLIVFVSIIITLSIFGAANVDFANADYIEAQTQHSSRKTLEDITVFGNGLSSAQVMFGSGGGANTELNVTLPKRCTVLSASMDIEPLFSPAYNYYDFNDTTNNAAWNGYCSNLPGSEKPTTFEKTKWASKDYTAAQNIDATMAEYSNPNVGNATTVRLYQLFKFKVTAANPTTFKFLWIGKSYEANAIMQYTNEINAYIYCPKNTTWVKFDYQQSTGITWSTMKINKEITKASDYIESTDSGVHFIIVGPVYNGMMIGSRTIATDYVNLTAFVDSPSYPKNIHLDVGNDGDYEWSESGDFEEEVTIGDTHGFKTELQEHVDAAGTEEGTTDIVLKFGTTSPGVIKLDKLLISIEALEHNEPPEQIAGKLDHYYMTEDDAATGDDLIDLTDCFTDDLDSPENLRFDLVDSGDPTTLEAVLDSDGFHLDFVPAQDFFGTVAFKVKAIDAGADEVADTFDDLERISSYFNVTVQPVNDAPSIIVTNKEMEVNEYDTLVFEATVSDIDDTEFEWSSNRSEQVTIEPDIDNSAKAEVTFEPAGNDVGKSVFFNLKVFDSGGSQGQFFKASDKVNLVVDVINENDPPELIDLTFLPDGFSLPIIEGNVVYLKNDYAALEDQYYNLSIAATDPDLGIDPDEKLTFSINTITAVDGILEIDSDSGQLTFLPTYKDIGMVKFTVTVTDRLGEYAAADFEVEVENINDAPMNARIILPEERKFSEDDWITFKGECFDEDTLIPNSIEHLGYFWYTNHSVVPLGMGQELTEEKLNVGWHLITLEVEDNAGFIATASIELQVVPSDDIDPDQGNTTPDDDDEDDDTTPADDDKLITGSSSDDKKANTIYLGLLAVIIVIVILVMIIFGIVKPRQKKKAEEEKQLLEQPIVPAVPAQPGVVGDAQFVAPIQISPTPEAVAPQSTQPEIQAYPPVEPTPQPAVPIATPPQTLPSPVAVVPDNTVPPKAIPVPAPQEPPQPVSAPAQQPQQPQQP